MQSTIRISVFAAALILGLVSGLRAETIWEKKASASSSTAAEESSGSGKLVIKDDVEISPTNFFLPEKLGTIREIWAPEAGAATPAGVEQPDLVVLIQDAHCNVEAQTNISEMLDYMIKTYHLDFVAVEGYEGYYDTSKVHALPDKKLKNEILDYFFNRGRVTGVEYLALVEPPKFEIFGIERKQAYFENYNAFLASIKLRSQAEQFVKDARDKTDAVVQKAFTPDEKKFIDNIRNYASGQIEISQYVAALTEMMKKYALAPEAPNLKIFLSIMDIEKQMTKDKVGAQQEALLKALQQKLSTIDNEQLVKLSLQYKTGKASSTRFYGLIAETCKKVNMDMAAYPDIDSFMKVVALQFRLNLKELLLETQRINEQIASALFKDAGKLRLFRLMQDLKIMSNLYLLELTREEWYYFRDNKEKLKKAFSESGEIEIEGAKYPLKFLPVPDTQASENFYQAAIKRDKILEANASVEARVKKKKFYVVVSGGFHTDGFVEEFRAKKAPYAVVTPLITQHQAKDYYMEVMTSMKTDLEENWK